LRVKNPGAATTTQGNDQGTELSIAPGARRLALKGALLSRSAKNGAHPPVVLVIEDEFFVRWNTARCLEDAGYVVVEAASGEEAIALCNSDTSIDVVFTDNQSRRRGRWLGRCRMFPHRSAGRSGGLYVRQIARSRALRFR